MSRRESLVNHCLSTIGVVLLSFFFACASWGLSGPQTAQLLNQRLAATPQRCVGDKPVHHCSGVLLLPTDQTHPRPFWNHGAEAGERGSERFRFLRADLDGAAPPGAVGYVLYDGFSALGLGKPYEVENDGEVVDGELRVRNWPQDSPQQLAVQALYYDIDQPDSLLLAQRGQRDYFDATGDWLPLVRFTAQGGFGFSQKEQLYNGYQVADRLNVRFARTGTTCTGGQAAYFCNGVLLRTTDVGDFHAWNPSPASINGNGVSFHYFRADLHTAIYKPQGFVMREQSYPVPEPLTLRCAFPFDAHTGGQADICTFRPSCASLNIHTPQAWAAAYASKPISSCYFDNSADDFQLSIEVRNANKSVDPYGWNEVILAAWRPNAGRDLPLEAFVFMPNHDGGNGLDGARVFQEDYVLTDQRYIPVLEVHPDATDGRVFTYNPQDQHIP